MTFEKFEDEVVRILQEKAEENVQIVKQDVRKNNGVIFNGLLISDNVLNISPTIYINKYYYSFLKGTSISKICADILEEYAAAKPERDLNTEQFMNFELAKDKIIMKLVNFERNEEYLQSVPHVKFHRLAIIFQYVVKRDMYKGIAKIVITNSHMNYWNTTCEDLLELAKANTPRLLPYRFTSMYDIFKECKELQKTRPDLLHEMSQNELPSLYILTNDFNIDGAVTLLYEGVLKKIATELNSDLIIIPSSVHEIILIPYRYSIGIQELNTIIQAVNQEEVADTEFLSDYAMYYSLNEDKILSDVDFLEIKTEGAE